MRTSVSAVAVLLAFERAMAELMQRTSGTTIHVRLVPESTCIGDHTSVLWSTGQWFVEGDATSIALVRLSGMLRKV